MFLNRVKKNVCRTSRIEGSVQGEARELCSYPAPFWKALGLGAAALSHLGPTSHVAMALTWTPLSLQTKPVDPTVDGGAQVRQAVNIECVSDFTEAPVLNIQFRWVVPGHCVLAEPRCLCRGLRGPR